jgi:hypothetical protein
MPFRPIDGDEQGLPSPKQSQQLGGEELILEARVVQQPIETRQGTAQLGHELHGHMPGHGQGAGLGHLGNGGNDWGQRLLLGAPKGT